MVSRPATVHRLTVEVGNLAAAVDFYYSQAYTTAPWPQRRGEPTPTLSRGQPADPTGQTAAIHGDRLEQAAQQLQAIRHDLQALAGWMDSWNPPAQQSSPPEPDPQDGTCGYEDCNYNVYSRGRCRRHYQSDRRLARQ